MQSSSTASSSSLQATPLDETPSAVILPPSGSKVLVAMSGGVDSSVAAALLREHQYDLVGVTMHLWDAGGQSQVGRCCAPEDRDDARKSCDVLGFPHYVIDERESFMDKVVNPFVAGYSKGITPSPCVTCNQQVKLGRLVEIADAFGCEYIATGHYARIERARIENDARGRVLLRRGLDRMKDQSYFLFGVPEEILARMVFPLGEMTKTDTRREGERLSVPNYQKKDSQELCFVPDGQIGTFVSRRRTDSEVNDGVIEDETGKVLGNHSGIEHFTIGQRKGLNLGGGGPMRFVLKILPEEKKVVVGSEEGLAHSRLVAGSAKWLVDRGDSFEAEVQIRYKHAPGKARIERKGENFEVFFHDPQRAISPGQAAVVYDGDLVLGGGLIESVS